MLSRLGQLLLSMLTSRFEEVISATMFAVAHEMMKKGRQTLLLVTASFVLAILLAAGVIISLLEATAQYDARGVIYFTALLTSSLIMATVSLLVLTFIFWPKNPTLKEATIRPNLTAPSSHPLEEILTTVMTEGMDYFKYRQQTKGRRATEHSQASP